MVRSSSSVNRLTCSSISRRTEKVMPLLFLGTTLHPAVIPGHTPIRDDMTCPSQGRHIGQLGFNGRGRFVAFGG